MFKAPEFVSWSLRAAPLALTLASAVGCSNEVPVGTLPEIAPALQGSASLSGSCDRTAPAGVTTLATGGADKHFFSLYLVGDTLYVSAQTDVFKMPLAGGTPTALNTDPIPQELLAGDIVVIGPTVYGLGGVGAIFSMPTDGGEMTVLHRAPKLRTHGYQLAADTASLYWSEGYSDGSTAEGWLMTMLLDGGEVTVLDSIDEGSNGMVVDGKNLFWTESTKGRVRRMPKGGGEATTIATDDDGPIGMAMDGESVYWRSAMTAMKAPKRGGDATSFGAGEPPQWKFPSQGSLGVAVNATHVYWFQDTFDTKNEDYPIGAKLMRAPRAGGPAEVVATFDSTWVNRPIACPGGVCWTSTDQLTSEHRVQRYNDCP